MSNRPTGMDADVLQPFVREWMERARLLQEALDRLGNRHRAPRIERSRDRQGRDRFTLVRRDGDVERLRKNGKGRATTTRFTLDEWAMIERVVLLRHGLQPADLLNPITGSVETTLGGGDLPPEA